GRRACRAGGRARPTRGGARGHGPHSTASEPATCLPPRRSPSPPRLHSGASRRDPPGNGSGPRRRPHPMTSATAVVADTQILIWYVIDPDRLSADAIAALEDATAADQPIYVSAHSL